MSSNRIPLTRTSPLEQRRRQDNAIQPDVDAGRGWREASHRFGSHAGDSRGVPRAQRYYQAPVHNLPEEDEDAEAVLDLPSHYQGQPAVFGGAHGGGGLSISSPRQEEPAMSVAGYGRQGAYAYGGSPPHLEQNQMSGALSTTSELLHEYSGRERQGAIFTIGRNSGEYPAYPPLYNRVDMDKLMDEYAGRTHRWPSPAYPQRYMESVQAAFPHMFSGDPAMSRGGRHGGSGRRLLSRLPSHAGSNERFDGNIQGQRSVPQGKSFARTRSRPSDMHPHSPRLEQQRRTQPRESLEDIMERFDLSGGRGSKHDSRSSH